jgi:hypothetical protein
MVSCLRQLLGLATHVTRQVVMESRSETCAVICGDSLRVSLRVPRKWIVGNARDQGRLALNVE